MILNVVSLFFSLIITTVITSPIPDQTCSSVVSLGEKKVSIFDVFKLHQCIPSESLIKLYSNDVPVSMEQLTICTGLRDIVLYGEEHKLLENNCPDDKNKEEYCLNDDVKQSNIEKLLSRSSSIKLPPSYINALDTLSRLNRESCRVVCGDETSEMCSVLVQLGQVFTKDSHLKSNTSTDVHIETKTNNPDTISEKGKPHIQQTGHRHTREVVNNDNNPKTDDQKLASTTNKEDILGESPEDTSIVKHNEERPAVTYPREELHVNDNKNPFIRDNKLSQSASQSLDDMHQFVSDRRTANPFDSHLQQDKNNRLPFDRQQFNNNHQPLSVQNNQQEYIKSNTDRSVFNDINAALSKGYRRNNNDNPNEPNRGLFSNNNLPFSQNQPKDSQRPQEPIDGKPSDKKQESFIGEQPKDSQRPQESIDGKPSDEKQGSFIGEQPKDSQRPQEPIDGKPSDEKQGSFIGEQPKDSQRPREPIDGKPSDEKQGSFIGEQPKDSQRPQEPIDGKPSDEKQGSFIGEQPKDSQRPREPIDGKPSDEKQGSFIGEQPKDSQRSREPIDGKPSDEKQGSFIGEQPKDSQRPREPIDGKPSDEKQGSFIDEQPKDSQRPREPIDGKPSDEKQESFIGEQPKDSQRPQESIDGKPLDEKQGSFIGEQPKDSQRPQEPIDGKPSDEKQGSFIGEQPKDSQRPQEPIDGKPSDEKQGSFIGEQPKDSQRPQESVDGKPSDEKQESFIGEQPKDSQRPQESIDGKPSDEKQGSFIGEQPKDSQRPQEPIDGKPSDEKQESFTKDSQKSQESIENNPSHVDDKLEPFDAVNQPKEPILPAFFNNVDDSKDDKTQLELEIDTDTDNDKKITNNKKNDIKTGIIEENIENPFHDDQTDDLKKEDKSDYLTTTDKKPSLTFSSTTKESNSQSNESSEYQGYGTYHFLSIFIFIAILVIVGYFLVHYRRKIQGGLIAYSEKSHKRHQYRPLSQQ